jgi:hypothetical protein
VAPQIAPNTIDRPVSSESATAAALKLLAYCRANQWAGYDPYDALNSRIFTAFPVLDARLPRLVLTQALKRSPVNLRRLASIPRTQNPKAIGLFLSAFVRMPWLGTARQDELISSMIARLTALRSPDTPYWCWGYSFPWQTRKVVVPRWAPNLVCTSFVGGALLDAYERRPESRYLSMAVSAAEFILNELHWTDGVVTGFSYPLRGLRIQIHNANFLGAALLCRVYRQTGEKTFLGPALRVARNAAGAQRADGSWDYGAHPTQRWIDNFHTGYNLCALKAISEAAETAEFDGVMRRGLEFYRTHFFREDGAARYFHDRTYPIDIHCVAQSIITLVTLADFDADNRRLAHSVFEWAMSHMWDPRGFFYYRVLRSCIIRTSYMRWSQAWMLLALSRLLEAPDDARTPTRGSMALA